MPDEKIKNATIDGTMLGIEHGCFTYMLYLEYEAGVQGAGGIKLDSYEECGNYLKHLLETIGVSQWEHLKGKYVRAVLENGRVVRIGHIVENKWFDVVPEDGK